VGTAAQEQRCLDLGDACVCSEPLDAAVLVGGDAFRNPADSLRKQCGPGGNGNTLTDGTAWTAEAAMELPREIEHVVAVGPVDGFNGATVTGVVGTGNETRRVCVRHYFRTSPDYEPKNQVSGGPCEANKAAELGFGGGNALLHWDFAEGEFWRLTIINFDADGNGADASYNLDADGDLLWEDCGEEWCRAEMCVSGNINGGADFFAEASIHGVESGRHVEWQRTGIGRPCPAGTACGLGGLTSVWIVNGYRQGACAGSRFVSHAMQAAWSEDAGQRIGPALEIEPEGATGDVVGQPGRPVLAD